MTDSNALTVIEYPERKPSAHETSPSFCIRLWQHMRLEASGEARVCCEYTRGYIEQDGVPVYTDRQSLMQIWNADTMRELRRAMVEGRRVAGCATCYADEAHGGVSVRASDNAAWERAALREPRDTFQAMMAETVDNDFRLPKLPATVEVEADNLCNFKCRMCNSHSSSLVARDPVHRQWNGVKHAPDRLAEVDIRRGRIPRLWPIGNLADELARDTGSNVDRLIFLGGEPFLLPEIPSLLERLVQAGRARRMSLVFISNGSIVPKWLALAEHFPRVDIAVSVDGYANDFEYIRYPGRWAKLVQNLSAFRRIPNVTLSVTTTIQINNVLGITRLFRYLDSNEICFTGHLLHYPGYLAVAVLPRAIRGLAAARLRDYAEDHCRPDSRARSLSFAAQIEEAGGDAGDPVLLRDFMLFTNDLDASRGQSIHRCDPELVELLEQAGYPWVHDTLHAPAASAAEETRRWRLALTEARRATAQLQQELDTARQMVLDESARLRAMQEAGAARVRRIGNELALLRRELGKVYASRSWRVTRPLRAARRMLSWRPRRGSSSGQSDAE